MLLGCLPLSRLLCQLIWLALLANEVDSRLLSKVVQTHDRCPGLGKELCRVGNTSVLLAGENQRRLRFGDECATESKVNCKGVADSSCDGQCGSCPCEFDDSGQLSAPYMQLMFAQMEPWCKKLSGEVNVLLIGLGGGELPQFLLRRCPTLSIDTVEYSGDVIAIARQFFGLQNSEERFGQRLRVQQADALAAVQQRAAVASATYDIVLIDCFAGGGEVPITCRSRELAEKVRYILKPAGVLLQNMWHYSRDKPEVAQQFIETTSLYRNVFQGSLQDLLVPMPPHIRWVDILQATKTS